MVMPKQTTSTAVNIQEYKGMLLVVLTPIRLTDAPTIAQVGDVLNALLQRQAVKPSIILDLSNVEAMSSQMLGNLVAFHKGIKKLKGRLTVAGTHRSIKPLFKVTKLDKLLTMKDTAEMAMKEFERKPL